MKTSGEIDHIDEEIGNTLFGGASPSFDDLELNGVSRVTNPHESQFPKGAMLTERDK